MCEEFKGALIKYLRDGSMFNDDVEPLWDIEYREGYGRCMIAKRDIQVNELIFCDRPLLIGPRVNNYDKIFCVSCYKVLPKLKLCLAKCKFPVCDECVDSKNHRRECELIRSWGLRNENRYSKHLFRALTVIRGLLLSSDDTKLMFMMACHENATIQGIEVEKILDEFDSLTSDCETVQTLKRISSVLNTNAFEVGVAFDYNPDHNISLRGLYPLAAVMNHNCVPNMRYTYDKSSNMAVRAASFIPKGEQIFNSYTKFLWGTQQRRVHLAYSKNFLCKCERCIDPTEFGSNISALKCIRPECNSIMLPVDPLVVKSPWKCEVCNLRLDHARISRISDILSKQIFNKILVDQMSSINHYLKDKLSSFLPPSNQFTIEVKLQIILKMKRDPNYEMTLEDYSDIESYCYDVLEIIDRLKVGECFVKGLLYYEILTAKIKLAELRKQEIDDKTRTYLLELLDKCWLILGNTNMEPQDLKTLIETFKLIK